jgi:hypothetical protein
VAEARDRVKVERQIENGKVKVKIRTPRGTFSAEADCPPGLARRDPPCVPPGLIRTLRVGPDRGVAEAAPDLSVYAPAESLRPPPRTTLAVAEPARPAEPAAPGAPDARVDLTGYHLHGAFAHRGDEAEGHVHDGQLGYEDTYLLAEDGEVIALTDLVTDDGAQFFMVDDAAAYGLPELGEGESYLMFGDSVVHVDAETYRLLTLVALGG